MPSLNNFVLCLVPQNSVVRTLLDEHGARLDCHVEFLDAPIASELQFRLDKLSNTLVVDWDASSADDLARMFQLNKSALLCAHVNVIVMARNITPALVAMSTEYGFVRVLQNEAQDNQLISALEIVLASLENDDELTTLNYALNRALASEDEIEIDVAVQNLYLKYPHLRRACVEYANMCIRHQRYTEAESIIHQALQTQPNDVRLLNAMSRLLMRKGQFLDALSILSQCNLLSPSNFDRLIMIGSCYFELEQYAEAKKSYAAALELDPEGAEAKKGLGAVALTIGDVNTALEFFRGTATEEEMASLFNTAGVVAVKQGQYEKGVGLYAAARLPIRKPVLVSKLLFNMGLAYRKWQKLAAAEHCFEEALRYSPENRKAADQLTTLRSMRPEKQIEHAAPREFTLQNPIAASLQASEAGSISPPQAVKGRIKIMNEKRSESAAASFMGDDD